MRAGTVVSAGLVAQRPVEVVELVAVVGHSRALVADIVEVVAVAVVVAFARIPQLETAVAAADILGHKEDSLGDCTAVEPVLVRSLPVGRSRLG